MSIQAITPYFFYGAVLGVLGLFLLLAGRHISPKTYPIGFLTVGSLVLGLSWYVLFWFMALTAGRVLAPWDQWARYAPPGGAWQRQLSDFFSRDTSQYLVALIVVGVSVGLFVLGMLRATNDERPRLPLAFAVTNLAFMLISVLSIALIYQAPNWWLSQLRLSGKVGYMWPDILVTIVLLGLLFGVQSRIATPSSWKR